MGHGSRGSWVIKCDPLSALNQVKSLTQKGMKYCVSVFWHATKVGKHSSKSESTPGKVNGNEQRDGR